MAWTGWPSTALIIGWAGHGLGSTWAALDRIWLAMGWDAHFLGWAVHGPSIPWAGLATGLQCPGMGWPCTCHGQCWCGYKLATSWPLAGHGSSWADLVWALLAMSWARAGLVWSSDDFGLGWRRAGLSCSRSGNDLRLAEHGLAFDRAGHGLSMSRPDLSMGLSWVGLVDHGPGLFRHWLAMGLIELVVD
jgi:hypothetical protein